MTSNFNLRGIATAATLGAALIGLAVSMVPAQAQGYYVEKQAKTSGFHSWDRLNLRQWPASHSQKIGQIKLGKRVYVERCIIKSGADWCKVHRGWKEGWVNGRYLTRMGHDFSSVHPAAFGWH
ncbi:MAG: SH3 domain-containing protein [Pseudomonadota bacterium]